MFFTLFYIFLALFYLFTLPKVRLYKEGLGWLPRFVSGESHGFLRPSQRSPWGAGILNKPKKLSFAKSHFHAHFSPKSFFSSFSPWFIMKPYLLAFIWSWIEFQKRHSNEIFGTNYHQFEFGLRRYFSSCIVIWEPHFLLVNTLCVSAYWSADISWYWLIFADHILFSLWSGLKSLLATNW